MKRRLRLLTDGDDLAATTCQSEREQTADHGFDDVGRSSEGRKRVREHEGHILKCFSSGLRSTEVFDQTGGHRK
jgi:hypothetical protein